MTSRGLPELIWGLPYNPLPSHTTTCHLFHWLIFKDSIINPGILDRWPLPNKERFLMPKEAAAFIHPYRHLDRQPRTPELTHRLSSSYNCVLMSWLIGNGNKGEVPSCYLFNGVPDVWLVDFNGNNGRAEWTMAVKLNGIKDIISLTTVHHNIIRRFVGFNGILET